MQSLKIVITFDVEQSTYEHDWHTLCEREDIIFWAQSTFYIFLFPFKKFSTSVGQSRLRSISDQYLENPLPLISTSKSAH